MIATQPIFTPSKAIKTAVTLLLQFDFCKILKFSGIHLSQRGSSWRSVFVENGFLGAILAFWKILCDLLIYCYIFLLKVVKDIPIKGLRCCNSKTAKCQKTQKTQCAVTTRYIAVTKNHVTQCNSKTPFFDVSYLITKQLTKICNSVTAFFKLRKKSRKHI